MTTKDKIDQALDGDGETPPWERNTSTVTEVTAAVVEAPAAPANPMTALAEVEEDYAPTTGRVYSETLEFDASELQIPRLRLANGLTEEIGAGTARVGQWLITGADPVDKAEIVILGATRFRELRDRQSQETHCKSDNGVFGVGDPGGPCKSCPMAQWGPNNPKTGKGTPPPCAEGFSYQVFSMTHGEGELALLDLKRTSLQVAKKINTALSMRKAKNFVVVLGSMDAKGPAGTYKTPTVDIRPITADERALVNEKLNG